MIRAHFILYVDSQSKARDFYRSVLGVSPSLDVEGMTQFDLPPGTILGLMPSKGIHKLLSPKLQDPRLANNIARSELYLEVENATPYHLRAIEAGGKELSPLMERNWGQRVCYSSDLDGHVLAFAEEL